MCKYCTLVGYSGVVTTLIFVFIQNAVAPRVGIIMGSDSDLPVMKDAAKILKEFDVHAEVFTINYCTSFSISVSSLPIVFTMKYLPKNLVMMQVKIVSAHRTPEMMFSYALSARERGIQVIIAGAGGAAHLPGRLSYPTK